MKKEARLLRIFIGESDKHEGKLLSDYLIELFRKEGLAGATMVRGMKGFGKNSHMHSTSILRLSSDLPIVIEVTDTKENIDRIKPAVLDAVKEGLVTEEKVEIIFYGTKAGTRSGTKT